LIEDEGNQTSINLSEYLEQTYDRFAPNYQIKNAEDDELELSMESKKSFKK